MSEFFSLLTEQWAAQSVLEWIAVVTAIGYVWLAARQSIWCWPCALVSTGIYTWLFWEVSLPFHTFLNAYYLGMALYGWLKWKGVDHEPLAVASWPLQTHLKWIAVIFLLAWGISALAATQLDPTYLYLDAFITVFSLFTLPCWWPTRYWKTGCTGLSLIFLVRTCTLPKVYCRPAACLCFTLCSPSTVMSPGANRCMTCLLPNPHRPDEPNRS